MLPGCIEQTKHLSARHVLTRPLYCVQLTGAGWMPYPGHAVCGSGLCESPGDTDQTNLVPAGSHWAGWGVRAHREGEGERVTNTYLAAEPQKQILKQLSHQNSKAPGTVELLQQLELQQSLLDACLLYVPEHAGHPLAQTSSPLVLRRGSTIVC